MNGEIDVLTLAVAKAVILPKVTEYDDGKQLIADGGKWVAGEALAASVAVSGTTLIFTDDGGTEE